MSCDDDKQKAAAAALTRMFSGQMVAGEDGQGKLMAPAVTVSKGFQFRSDDPDKSKDTVVIEVADPSVSTSKGAMEVGKAAMAVLKQIPGIRDVAVVDTPEEYIRRVKGEVTTLIEKGAKIPKDFLEWRGFDPKYGAGTIPDHAIQFDSGDRGVRAWLNIPAREGESNAAEATKVAENIRARLPEIKTKLKERLMKYVPSLDAAGQKAMDDIDITVNTFDSDKNTTIMLNIVSKEQKHMQEHPDAKAENPEALKNTNPLIKLSKEQLGKALGRSILMTGEKASSIFPMVAGREDMNRAILKELVKHAEAHPEDKPLVEQLKKEELFQPTQQWNLPAAERHEWKRTPSIGVESDKPGVLKVSIQMAAGEGDKLIAKIAGAMQQHDHAEHAHPTPLVTVAQPQQMQDATKPLEEAMDFLSKLTDRIGAQGGAPAQNMWTDILNAQKQEKAQGTNPPTLAV